MSDSNTQLSSILKGLALAGSAAISAIVANKCSQSINNREVQLKQLLKLVEQKAESQSAQPSELDAENGLDQQILSAFAKSNNQKKESSQNLENELALEKQISKSVNESNKLVHKICITGGPCAGKTSGLVLLSEKLRDEGFNVFTVPEAATMIANGGGMIDMSHYDDTQQINFQKALMKTQVQLEDSFHGIAKLSNRKSVILCDRGLMDGSAYLPPNLWNKMLEQMGLTEVQIRDKRYDLVIHLVTAADGAQNYYNKDNDVRHESPSDAIVVDRKLQLAWLGHPNYQIIDNISVKNFEDKLDKLVSIVRLSVGLSGSLNKVHKRYLLEYSNFVSSNEANIKIQKFYIEDVFIQHNLPIKDKNHKIYTKVRRRGQGSQFVYLWSQNEFINDVQVSTQKKQLNFKEYLFLLSLRDPTRQPLLKERICFMWEGIYYVIDTYLNVKEGFSLLKAKLQEDQEIKIPGFITVKRDVSNEKGYTSRVLAKKDWYVPEGDEEILNIRKDSL
ncbi:AAA domain protein (macronuclear) [Tetrahymena thermophila SB210]|uniref:AAA domain protein n=1 Tax=Tetrahymena thermophila (strain SB210) TaxID=312017 RepID=I7M4P0_TETTS|nr:AAA domain protein [Tetrahymena thermophila SB210]EAS07761.2 AAA domain protein [Tetrahymena thermophila SB210]|eukprot:XP_001028003.2 AAA domain protein [Tetrahymena thermophila SB210]